MNDIDKMLGDSSVLGGGGDVYGSMYKDGQFTAYLTIRDGLELKKLACVQINFDLSGTSSTEQILAMASAELFQLPSSLTKKVKTQQLETYAKKNLFRIFLTSIVNFLNDPADASSVNRAVVPYLFTEEKGGRMAVLNSDFLFGEGKDAMTFEIYRPTGDGRVEPFVSVESKLFGIEKIRPILPALLHVMGTCEQALIVAPKPPEGGAPNGQAPGADGPK